MNYCRSIFRFGGFPTGLEPALDSSINRSATELTWSQPSSFAFPAATKTAATMSAVSQLIFYHDTVLSFFRRRRDANQSRRRTFKFNRLARASVNLWASC
jgi:hypothetical protein